MAPARRGAVLRPLCLSASCGLFRCLVCWPTEPASRCVGGQRNKRIARRRLDRINRVSRDCACPEIGALRFVDTKEAPKLWPIWYPNEGSFATIWKGSIAGQPRPKIASSAVKQTTKFGECQATGHARRPAPRFSNLFGAAGLESFFVGSQSIRHGDSTQHERFRRSAGCSENQGKTTRGEYRRNVGKKESLAFWNNFCGGRGLGLAGAPLCGGAACGGTICFEHPQCEGGVSVRFWSFLSAANTGTMAARAATVACSQGENGSTGSIDLSVSFSA